MLLMAICFATHAGARDRAQVYYFRAVNPCPSTGLLRGACPGFQVDHIAALCAGGADDPANMQWLDIPEHKAKTKLDVRYCAILRRQ